MNLSFSKYQGAGNDFILIDNRNELLSFKKEQIAFLCDRKFGIGADGLILLQKAPGYDFKMIYYNSDGQESTMCGNGGRCITLFAHHLELVQNDASFLAIDGDHKSSILENGDIALGMNDVNHIQFEDNETILDTGSPHIVINTNELDTLNVSKIGAEIRNQHRFGKSGINVNFIQQKNKKLYIRTYERGVEDETLACGTGVTAAAISSVGHQIGEFNIPVISRGGLLSVSFTKQISDAATKITLKGPAELVFTGKLQIK